MFEYKGYIGQVEFDSDANIFHGEVINTQDVITFQGKSVTELKKALKDSIETYLDFCKKRNREPNKPFSGNFLIRLTPQEHQQIYIAARQSGKSLNKWAGAVLSKAANRSQ